MKCYTQPCILRLAKIISKLCHITYSYLPVPTSLSFWHFRNSREGNKTHGRISAQIHSYDSPSILPHADRDIYTFLSYIRVHSSVQAHNQSRLLSICSSIEAIYLSQNNFYILPSRHMRCCTWGTPKFQIRAVWCGPIKEEL